MTDENNGRRIQFWIDNLQDPRERSLAREMIDMPVQLAIARLAVELHRHEHSRPMRATLEAVTGSGIGAAVIIGALIAVRAAGWV